MHTREYGSVYCFIHFYKRKLNLHLLRITFFVECLKLRLELRTAKSIFETDNIPIVSQKDPLTAKIIRNAHLANKDGPGVVHNIAKTTQAISVRSMGLRIARVNNLSKNNLSRRLFSLNQKTMLIRKGEKIFYIFTYVIIFWVLSLYHFPFGSGQPYF